MKRSRERVLCFEPADADDFSHALRDRFPRIRFRMFHYWKRQLMPATGAEPRRDIPLFDSLGDPAEWLFYAWVEPEGWEPVWEGPNKEKIYIVANKPRLQFVFQRSLRVPPRTGTNLGTGRIWAYYEADDKEHARFLGAVWRIAAKLSSNVHDVIDDKSGEVRIKATGTMVWSGWHARDWCSKKLNRRLAGNLRPPT